MKLRGAQETSPDASSSSITPSSAATAGSGSGSGSGSSVASPSASAEGASRGVAQHGFSNRYVFSGWEG